ncbi:MAG: glycine zipper family protein [Syntrophales bacterium LBB04]|nr:glycine zipper family protein [Syntrophales bacterium LBB04]
MKPRRKMNKMTMVGLGLLFLSTVSGLVACYPMSERVSPQPMTATTGVHPRPSVTQVYFYPLKGQTIEQQSRDHYECYNWAIKQTHFDPSLSPRQPEHRVKVVPLPPPGHDTAVFAIAGAVLGAVLGGPRHAAGGALIGASGGALVGAASDSARIEEARQQEETYARWDQAQRAQFEQKELDFRRAMSACLEGRHYNVR